MVAASLGLLSCNSPDPAKHRAERQAHMDSLKTELLQADISFSKLSEEKGRNAAFLEYANENETLYADVINKCLSVLKTQIIGQIQEICYDSGSDDKRYCCMHNHKDTPNDDPKYCYFYTFADIEMPSTAIANLCCLHRKNKIFSQIDSKLKNSLQDKHKLKLFESLI